MSSVFELFPRHEHRQPWLRAKHVAPNFCPGKDTLDTACTCPDVMYSTRISIRTGLSVSRLYCGCCDLLLEINP